MKRLIFLLAGLFLLASDVEFGYAWFGLDKMAIYMWFIWFFKIATVLGFFMIGSLLTLMAFLTDDFK
jgi:hypothetical protein